MDLRAYLTIQQDEDRRAGRDVFMEAPTERCPKCCARVGSNRYGQTPDGLMVRCSNCTDGRVPISDTVPCPECGGSGGFEWRDPDGAPDGVQCDSCEGSGRVPRVVEVVRPEMACDVAVCGQVWSRCADCLPRAIVALAQVEALRVHETFTDAIPARRNAIVVRQGRVLHYRAEQIKATDAIYAFPDGPPEPGTVLWRPHGWEAVEEQTAVPCRQCGASGVDRHRSSPGETWPCLACDGHRRVPLPDLPPGHIYATGDEDQ